MKVPRQFKLALAAVVSVAMCAFGVAESNPLLGGSLLFAALAGWWYTEWSGEGRGLQRWATNLILMGVLIGAIVRAGQGGAMVSAFNGFLACLIAVKLWEKREVRDYAQVLTLSLFLAVGATLNHNSLGVGLSLFALVPLLAYSAMLFQVISGEARVKRADGVSQGERAHLGTLSLNSALVACLISAGVFVMIPRGISPPAGMSAFGKLLGGRVTGVSDQVRLGQGGLISESQAVALHVRISDGTGQVLGGDSQIQYLRGSVLDQYRDGTWTRAQGGPIGELAVASNDVAVVEIKDPPDVSLAPRVLQEFELRGIGSTDAQLFSLYRPAVVREDPPRDRATDYSPSITRYRFDRVSGWFTRSGSPGPLAYKVTSLPGERERGAVSRRGLVSFPSERLGAQARKVLTDAGLEPDPAKRDEADDNLAARVLESFLRRECDYTLDIQAAPSGVDPTEWFVFTERRGHCEYFASALAGMCRSVGIDARVIAGYVATQFDSELQAYVVRASNAHAWVEVNTSPGTWRTFDATPPADFDRLHGPPQGLLLRLSRLLGDMEDVWASRVVSFDQTTQARMFGRSARGLATQDWGSSLRSWFRKRSDSPEAGLWTRRLAPIGLTVVVVLVLGFVVLRIVRRRRPPAIGVKLEPRLAELRSELLTLCARIQMPRPESATLMRHAQSVAKARPEMSEDVLAAANLLYRACFANDPVNSSEAARIGRKLRRYR